MDDKGRWIDNVFIERLWRSVKYEEVYLHAYAHGIEARVALRHARPGVSRWLDHTAPDRGLRQDREHATRTASGA